MKRKKWFSREVKKKKPTCRLENIPCADCRRYVHSEVWIDYSTIYAKCPLCGKRLGIEILDERAKSMHLRVKVSVRYEGEFMKKTVAHGYEKLSTTSSDIMVMNDSVRDFSDAIRVSNKEMSITYFPDKDNENIFNWIVTQRETTIYSVTGPSNFSVSTNNRSLCAKKSHMLSIRELNTLSG